MNKEKFIRLLLELNAFVSVSEILNDSEVRDKFREFLKDWEIMVNRAELRQGVNRGNNR